MTPITTFKPTLMQRLLGRNYKWWYVVYFNYSTIKTNLTAFYVSQFSYVSEALIIVFIWFKSNPDPTILTYLLIGRVFKAFIASYYHVDLSNSINSGSISNKLMYPLNFLILEFYNNLGQRIAKNPPTVIGLVVAALIGNFVFTNLTVPNIINLFLVLLCIPVAFFVQFVMSVILGSWSFFVIDKRDVWAYHQAYEKLFLILAGYYIPLNDSALPTFLQYLPFSYVLHHPMQIYLGKYSPTEILYVFIGGIAWCVILYFLAKLVFKAGLKRNESVGL